MPDDWLSTLLDESVRAGAAVAVILTGVIIGTLFMVNLKWPIFISHRVHVERVTAETKRADKAEQDASDDHAQQLRDLSERMANFRADYADRMRQASEDHARALDVLVKVLESKDRDIESWRLAWNVADQAGSEEGEARWDEIRANMAATNAGMVVMQRVILELQRKAGALRELEASGDGGGSNHVL